MVVPIDPTSAGFLYAENRQMPMHVGGLQLFEKPEDAPATTPASSTRHFSQQDDIAPLFLKRPTRGITTAGQWVWTEDDNFDLEYHFRHSALPKPGRIRELLDLCSRLHSTRLARERPLWEAHLIEGLRDGRVALYTKLHHSLVDGISAMRLMQNVMSTDPDERDMPPLWAARPNGEEAKDRDEAEGNLAAVPIDALRSALGITADAAGLPGALIKTLRSGLKNETSALSLYAPRTMFNTTITGSRRFAAEGWPLERLRGHRQGHRHHAQRRRPGDVLRCDPELPGRPRLAAGLHARLDGPGRAARQGREGDRRRERRGRGDGQAGHRPGRPRRPTGLHPPVDG